MEKDPNLQLFYSGIVDALKTGHIKPEYVIHEGWGQSVFSGSIVDISFYYVLFELIQKCESNALEKIAKIVGEMNDGKDFYSRRLTIDELYETLSIIRFEAASFLLGKIECTDGVYSEARNALNNEDKSRFVEAIKGCNTIKIKPVVNCVLFLQKMKIVFEEKKREVFGYPLEDNLDFATRGDSIVITDSLNNKCVIDPNDYDNMRKQLALVFRRWRDWYYPSILRKGASNKEYDQEWVCSYKYFAFLFQYCYLRDNGLLRYNVKEAFEYLFTLPAVRGLYDEGIECWKNNSWKEKMLELESMLQDNTTDEGKKSINDSETPILQNEEPGSKESISTIGDTTWHLPDDFFTESYIDTCGVNEFFPMFLEHKIKLGRVDKEKLPKVKKHYRLLFEGFINWLAEEGYIDNDSVTKSSFAHALTGRKVDEETKTVTWKRAHKGSSIQNNWTNNISYMIRELYPYRITDEKCNTIGKYDHLLKVFMFEAGNTKVSVGSSRAKYVDGDFKNKVDEFVLDVDLLAKAYGISPK